MIRVRFPTGVTIQYNTATRVHHFTSVMRISEPNNDTVADIPHASMAIIEFIPACRVYQACGDENGTRMDTLFQAIHAIKAKISKLSTAERKRR